MDFKKTITPPVPQVDSVHIINKPLSEKEEEYAEPHEEEEAEYEGDLDEVHEALREQIMLERYSITVYDSLACWAYKNNFINMSNWLFEKATEERGHQMKLMKLLSNMGIPLYLKDMKSPKLKFKDAEEALLFALEHEESVTESLTKLQILAEKAKDRKVYAFLDWFLLEQIEEEAILMDLHSAFKLSSDLLQFDLYFKTLTKQ